MSKAKYDGERCLSCAWWVAPANRTLAAPYCACTEKTTSPDFRCDLFVISPQCRIARALERIADRLTAKDSELARIWADAFDLRKDGES